MAAGAVVVVIKLLALRVLAVLVGEELEDLAQQRRLLARPIRVVVVVVQV